MAQSLSRKTEVAVDGATGYVGNHLVKALSEKGYLPHCLVRKESRPEDIQFLKSLGCQLTIVGDENLSDSLRNAPVLVHLIGSIAPKRGERLQDLHVNLSRKFFEAARKAGVQKVVLLSTLGSARNAASEYHRTKWQMEEGLRHSGIPFVILRSSLIIGKTTGHRDSKLVRRYLDLIKTSRRVPLILGGQNKIQPVSVEDLAQALCKVIGENTWNYSTLDIAGNEVLTLKEFVERLMKMAGVKKDFREFPEWLLNLAALGCEAFQRVPLISRDQIKAAYSDGTTRHNALVERLGIPPKMVDESLRNYVAA